MISIPAAAISKIAINNNRKQAAALRAPVVTMRNASTDAVHAIMLLALRKERIFHVPRIFA